MSDGSLRAPATAPPAHGDEVPPPYGSGPSAPTPTGRPKRVRIHHLRELKERGERWPMLTTYDVYTAEIFDEAGIPVLLVGDSAANNVYGYDSTLPVTVEELLPLVRAVVRSTRRAFVVADLPFGSYEVSPQQALTTAIRFMKEGGCHAVKFEGGVRVAEQIRLVTEAGIPVMGHIGFTPQSEHRLGGYRVQGRGAGASRLLEDAHAVAEAGAYAMVLEMVPGDLAAQVTAEVPIANVGIGAGAQCDAQVLVWQDMLGLRQGKVTRFVKQYANLAQTISDAAAAYVADVRDGSFPTPAHTFESTTDSPNATTKPAGSPAPGTNAARGGTP
jgi:3-methyl-2-oxobutanoate hydroxymethyltransferase